MKKERPRKHPEYYAITAYQILARKSDADMAKILDIAPRTYQEKVRGWADFTVQEGTILAQELGRTRDELFVT